MMPNKLPDYMFADAVDSGLTRLEIADRLGVNERTVRRRLRALGLVPVHGHDVDRDRRKLVRYAGKTGGPLADLTEQQRKDYDVLVYKGRYSRAEALAMVKRGAQ
jgi:AraC-like DNA-binding protein